MTRRPVVMGLVLGMVSGHLAAQQSKPASTQPAAVPLPAARLQKPIRCSGVLAIEDFNRCTSSRNLLRGDTGTFNAPSFVKGENEIKHLYYPGIAAGDCALHLQYTLSKPGTTAGYWTRLQGQDWRKYKEQKACLCFWAKGLKDVPSTDRLKIDLKTGSRAPLEMESHVVTGITAEWQQFAIPLSGFDGLEAWDAMYEIAFALVFDDAEQDKQPHRGSILLDNVEIRTHLPEPARATSRPQAQTGSGHP